MANQQRSTSEKWKKYLAGIVLLMLAGAGVVWYLFTLKFEDTGKTRADFSVNAIDLIKEFEQNDTLANRKYTEKIVTVNGTISSLEKADTTFNLKMTDSITGSYLIFAFQSNAGDAIRRLKAGDRVSVKGSCSGGVYSEILETRYISFKRCVIINKK